MIKTYHVTTVPPEEIGPKLYPITHFGDWKIGITQCTRTLGKNRLKRGTENCQIFFIYEAILPNKRPLKVRDFKDSSPKGLIRELAYNPKYQFLEITPEIYRNFYNEQRSLGTDRSSIETLSGRQKASQMIKNKGFDLLTYINENGVELEGKRFIEKNLQRLDIDCCLEDGSETCFVNLESVSYTLCCKIPTEVIELFFKNSPLREGLWGLFDN